MKRLVFAVAFFGAMTAALFVRCGGIINGYLDDAGVYHGGDGAVLFVPASACVGFDAAHVADPPPSCDPDAGLDEAGSTLGCAGWPSVPPGFPWDLVGCAPTADASACEALYDRRRAVACPSPDPIGDMYCTAWAQQFVVTGEAVAYCNFNSDTLEHPDAAFYVCDWQASPSGGFVCPGSAMVVLGTDAAVVDPSGIGCRFPCQP